MWERQQVHGFLELAKRQRQVCRIIHNQYMQRRARKKNHSTWLAICIILSQLCWGKCKGRAHICPLLHTAVSLAQVLPSKECHFSYQISPPSLKHSISVIGKKGHTWKRQKDSPTQGAGVIGAKGTWPIYTGGTTWAGSYQPQLLTAGQLHELPSVWGGLSCVHMVLQTSS